MSKFDLKTPPETRVEIITSMCYTWDHEFGAPFQPWHKIFNCAEEDMPEGVSKGFGFTDEDRESLWNRMAQLYDHHVAPYRNPRS